MNDLQLTRRIGALLTLGVFAIYFITMAPTTSFWDCGEFIAAAFNLGIPHPPGSPLYSIVGRVFSLVPIEGPLIGMGLLPEYSDVAVRINIMSPLAGAFSALFCYLVILRLMRTWKGKLARTDIEGRPITDWTAHVGAVAGTLIFALADSNWFNAVEAEMYAYAIFLTMLALWLGLKWADSVGEPMHLSYGLFIAYLMGLAGGLHQLCLLVLPSVALLALFTYVRDRRDPWIILGSLILMVAGAYFAMHALNAASLTGDPFSPPASSFGISDDPFTYLQISVLLAVILGVGGIVLSFFTRTVDWRDFWTVLLVGAAAVATVQTAIGIFFWTQNVQEFPTTRLLGGLVAGALLYVIASGSKRPKLPVLKSYHLSVALLILVIVGYSTYLVLKIRSGLNPIIDQNNPENWQNFFSFLAREQYGTESMSLIIFDRRADFSWQFWDMLVKYLLQQFPASITGALFDWKIYFRSAMEPIYYGMRVPDLPLILMFLGILWHYDHDKPRFLALLVLWGISGIGLAVYLNMPDPQPRERDYVFTGATTVMAIWMGMGITGLIRSTEQWLANKSFHKPAVIGVATLSMLVPVWFLAGYPLVDEYSSDRSVRYTNWAKHNRHYDTVAYDYAYNILESCAPGGILFTNGDNDTFPLWYLQEVHGFRKDVRVVNLSLLNTGWYIEQLRDNPPEIPFDNRYTDEYIKNVLTAHDLEALIRARRIDVVDGSPFDREGRLIGWRTKQVAAAANDTARAVLDDGTVLRGVVRNPRGPEVSILDMRTYGWTTVDRSRIVEMDTGRVQLVWDLPAPPEYPVLRVQDVMIYQLINWAKWERPIYFAVTVSGSNRIGLDPFLRMEGMVLKLEMTPHDGDHGPASSYGINIEAQQFNLDSVYVIRNLKNPKAYMDDNAQKLISNYRSAYLQLADAYIRMGTPDALENARETLESMKERLPLDWRSAYTAATFTRAAGPELRPLSQAYAEHAGIILGREVQQTDTFDPYLLEQVIRTGQLLRFTDRPEEAGELLIASLARMAESPHISIAERVTVLYQAGLSYIDAGQLQRARELIEQSRMHLVSLLQSPATEQALRQALRMDPQRLVNEMRNELDMIDAELGRDPGGMTTPGIGQ